MKTEYRNRYIADWCNSQSAFLRSVEKLDHAVDSIREKYGMDAIQRASFLKQDRIDHMNGGISREKRTVDYKNEKVI